MSHEVNQIVNAYREQQVVREEGFGELLTHQNELNELTVRQLKQLLLNAAEGPMTNPDLVAKRVAAETKQASILNGFKFKLTGQPITVNQIDDKLEKKNRREFWVIHAADGSCIATNLLSTNSAGSVSKPADHQT